MSATPLLDHVYLADVQPGDVVDIFTEEGTYRIIRTNMSWYLGTCIFNVLIVPDIKRRKARKNLLTASRVDVYPDAVIGAQLRLRAYSRNGERFTAIRSGVIQGVCINGEVVARS